MAVRVELARHLNWTRLGMEWTLCALDVTRLRAAAFRRRGGGRANGGEILEIDKLSAAIARTANGRRGQRERAAKLNSLAGSSAAAASESDDNHRTGAAESERDRAQTPNAPGRQP